MDIARYETIGHRYAPTRREDPHLRDRILACLGDSTSVVNVGAGAGSYEPSDRYVIAVEPSDVMARQRPDHRVPALRCSAYPLPLRDDSVDAAMAVVTVHHWDDELERGVRELRRVTRGPVVIVTYDPTRHASTALTEAAVGRFTVARSSSARCNMAAAVSSRAPTALATCTKARAALLAPSRRSGAGQGVRRSPRPGCRAPL